MVSQHETAGHIASKSGSRGRSAMASWDQRFSSLLVSLDLSPEDGAAQLQSGSHQVNPLQSWGKL